MKKIISCFLIIMILVMTLTGCQLLQREKTKSASESLEELFTTLDLMDASISELQKEMEAGNVTSEQLTQMYIDRIDAYDARFKLNSIITVNPDALKDARKLDREREEGELRGALHGIPIVVKANCDVAGMATSSGANALANMIAPKDSFVVKRLRDAGAVILAQANLSEFAYSSITSRSSLGGYVHNAYDTSKTPGGSSGGTAVAVTCNFAAAGIGTDTGGSIRNPSSLSNLYGIRPSKGLTSVSGILPLSVYRDTVGPMARTAEDTALMLEIMAGTDKQDDYTLEADADALLGDGYSQSLSADALKGMRIGYLESSFSYSNTNAGETVYDTPDHKVEQMLNRTLTNLRKAGAEPVDISEWLTTDQIKTLSKGVKTETFEYDLNRYLSEKGDAAPYKTVKEIKESGKDGVMYINLDLNIKDEAKLADSFEKTKNPYTMKVGSYQRIPNWKKVLDARKKISALMKKHDIDAVMYMNNFDVSGDENDTSNDNKHNKADYDLIFSPLFGLPEISLPMGFATTDTQHREEMPLGMSVFADFGQEKKLLQIAYAYEQQAGGSVRRMPELTPALEDKALNAFLADLIDKVYSIDYPSGVKKPEGKVQLMLNACKKAEAVNTKDPYATYDAAKELAQAYDKVMAELEAD